MVLDERLGQIRDASALGQVNPAPMSSVTLSRTARGATQVEVKCYAADIDEAAARATALYDTLTAMYATRFEGA